MMLRLIKLIKKQQRQITCPLLILRGSLLPEIKINAKKDKIRISGVVYTKNSGSVTPPPAPTPTTVTATFTIAKTATVTPKLELFTTDNVPANGLVSSAPAAPTLSNVTLKYKVGNGTEKTKTYSSIAFDIGYHWDAANEKTDTTKIDKYNKMLDLFTNESFAVGDAVVVSVTGTNLPNLKGNIIDDSNNGWSNLAGNGNGEEAWDTPFN